DRSIGGNGRGEEGDPCGAQGEGADDARRLGIGFGDCHGLAVRIGSRPGGDAVRTGPQSVERDQRIVHLLQPFGQPTGRPRQSGGRSGARGKLGGAVHCHLIGEGSIGAPAGGERQHDADLHQRKHGLAYARRVAEQQAIAVKGHEQRDEPGQQQRERRA
ncbi:hypothetical protein QU38_02145, partial [Staphylococcus aureus]